MTHRQAWQDLRRYHVAGSNEIRIVAAERMTNGLVIKFQDGKCAFYSTDLLFKVFPQATKLDETEPETTW